MENETPVIRPTWRGFVMLAGAFFALCTVFVSLVTALEAWQEHAQARWPVATAQIQSCSVDPYPWADLKAMYVVCVAHFLAGNEPIVARLHSRTTPARETIYWRWPKNQIGEVQMQSWVDEHPQGTPIQVHYDPLNHANAILVASDMPLGGSRTPGNLRLLAIMAALSAAILVVGMFVRPRRQTERSGT